MYRNNLITFEMPHLQDQFLLVICWHSFSEWGKECVALCFSYKASQYLIFEWPQPITGQITRDARLQIADTPLTFI